MESNHKLSPEKAYAKSEVESFRSRVIAELEGMACETILKEFYEKGKLVTRKVFKYDNKTMSEAIERIKNLK